MITPLHDNCVVRVKPLPEKTGSIIRVQRDELAREAEIIAVGPECREAKAGQSVYVNVLVGHEVGDVLLIPEHAIYGYVDRSAASEREAAG